MADKSEALVMGLKWMICPITAPHSKGAIFSRMLTRRAVISLLGPGTASMVVENLKKYASCDESGQSTRNRRFK
eukprot:3093461-Pyramimonas_sp.AAC.2